MNLRSLDLNLLVIFDALMAERSITRAAQLVGMTPSAVSHALRRLRDTFQDALLERTPEGMVPTTRALDLHPRVHAALADIRRAVDQQLHFDPATSERTFKVRIADYQISCLLPRVCARVRAEAPNLMLDVEYIGDEDSFSEPGEIHVRVCAGAVGPEYRHTRILRDRFVVAMRRDHPAAGKPLSLAELVALPWVRVSATTIGTKIFDAALARRGLTRRVPLTIPSVAALVPILEHSDVCTVLPELWRKLYTSPERIASTPLPLPEMEFTVDLIWSTADDGDAGHRWLRTLIEEEFRRLTEAADEPGDDPTRLDSLPAVA